MTRACLTVRGAEATHFLQNLVTCDVETLVPGDLTFGALLTPQGKVLFDFFILRETDGYLFDTLADARDALVQRLTFYKLRADVDVAADERAVRLGPDGSTDPRSSALPNRSYGSAALGDTEGALLRRIQAGVPEAGSDFAYGEVFPHDVLMDRLEKPGSGVAMRKGCYVGQEVVSRMQHRGTARRRPIILRSQAALRPGSPVLADGREIGSVGSVANDLGLAIVRLDRAQAASEVSVDGKSVEWAASPLLDA